LLGDHHVERHVHHWHHHHGLEAVAGHLVSPRHVAERPPHHEHAGVGVAADPRPTFSPRAQAALDRHGDGGRRNVDLLPRHRGEDVLKGIVRLQEEVAEHVGRGDDLAVGLDVDGDQLASAYLELTAHPKLLVVARGPPGPHVSSCPVTERRLRGTYAGRVLNRAACSRVNTLVLTSAAWLSPRELGAHLAL